VEQQKIATGTYFFFVHAKRLLRVVLARCVMCVCKKIGGGKMKIQILFL
jgi:hypothetical protein